MKTEKGKRYDDDTNTYGCMSSFKCLAWKIQLERKNASSFKIVAVTKVTQDTNILRHDCYLQTTLSRLYLLLESYMLISLEITSSV